MKNLNIPDLHLELSNLYYSTEHEYQEGFGTAMFNPETGKEIGADIVTPMLTNVKELKDEPLLEEEQLCDAALMKMPETQYSSEPSPDFEISYSYSSFITKQQRALNGRFLINKVINANNFYELKIVRESFLALSKKEWALNYSDISKFWSKYKITKEYLNNKKLKAA